MEKVKVSVVMPSLNVGQYIEECLQSVVNQSLKEIEIICVDAGSTDGTLEIIEKFASQDARIKVIHADKKSYGYQMNLGFAQATGEYIGIVETDDFIPQNMYQELYEVAKTQNAQIVKADFYRFKIEDNKIVRKYERLDSSGKYYNRIIDPAKEQKIFRSVMNTWSGIYERAFIEENHITHNETPGASYQDNGLFLKGFCCAKRVYFVDKPYYMNRRDNPNSSVKSKEKIYCMSEESNLNYEWLKQDEKRLKTFIGPYFMHKFFNLNATFYRIAPEYRKDYVMHFSEELKKHIDRKEYNRKILTSYEWHLIKMIAYEPLNFYRIYETNCRYLLTARILGRLDRFFRKIDNHHFINENIFSRRRLWGAKGAKEQEKWWNKIDSVPYEK